MDNINTNQGGLTSSNENVLRVRDAIIERIFSDGKIGYVTISYGILDSNNNICMNLVTLIVGPNTIIKDIFGENFPFGALREGMIVDSDFSAIMTKSNPPHSKAFRIIVSYKNWPFNFKIGRVMKVDLKNRFLITGDSDDIYSQVRFVVTDSTLILDRKGNRIRLKDIRPGQFVRIEHANFMTASIPPQTTAFRIQVL